MEGKRLKMVIHIKKGRIDNNGLIAIYEMFKGLHEKEENSAESVLYLMNAIHLVILTPYGKMYIIKKNITYMYRTFHMKDTKFKYGEGYIL